MLRYTKCPVCSSGKISLHLFCKDYFVSGESFELYKCASCELIFTQGYPKESEIARYYQSDEYISHSDTSKSFSNKLYKIAREIMLKRKRKFVEKKTGMRKGSLLDIGCGTGYFAGSMKEAGWQVTGIEVDKKAREFAAQRFKLKVLSPDQITFIPSKSIDCITLWHVLEHFHDPLRYLSQISNLLKPGGVCIVALPNCSSYDAIHYGKYWAAYDVPRHLWHFQPSSFNSFLENTGFRCEEIRNLPFDAFYISVMSEKYKGSGFSFIRGIVKGKLFFLKSMFNVKRSSSLIYILRQGAESGGRGF